MSDLRETWKAMRPARRVLAVGGLIMAFAAAAGVGAALANGPRVGQEAAILPVESPDDPAETPQSFAPGETPPALPPEPTLAPSLEPGPSPTPTPPGADPLLGADGRFTVLLLGSDYRPSHPGNRTDAIMVVSMDPATGKTAAVSIPRDLLNFPLPNGTVYSGKVNALYQHLLSTTKNGNAAMKQAVGKVLGVEIDGLVLIGFDGVQKLVEAVGGVTVDMPKAYYDPYYWVNGHTQGWGLSAGRHTLDGENALIMARSRKGDNDYLRVMRQQQLVMAALEKVRTLGADVLPKLLRIAAQTVRTDLPRDRVAEIFDIVSRSDLAGARRTALTPGPFGVILGSSAYQLDVKKVRAWVDKRFPPVSKGATWPPAATAAPASSTAASPVP